MKAQRIGYILVSLLLVLTWAGWAYPLTPYDDFSGAWINSGRWVLQEFVREVRSGKLYSGITAYGDSEFNFLYAVNPNTIYAFEADVALTEVEATYDPGDPNTSTFSHAGVAGVFYNDGTGTAGSAVGDVMAQVRLTYSRGQLKGEYYVIKYTNQAGTEWVVLHNDQISGPIALNQTYKLSVRFEPALKRFTFGVGVNTVVWVAPGAVNPPLPEVGWKALRTGVQAPAGHWGRVSATMDNVSARNVNAATIFADDFSAPPIDNTKWMPNLEALREIENGKLQLQYRRINITSNQGMALPFQNPELINEVQARVSLSQFDKTVTNTNLQARIFGYFFNATGDPSSNYLDEIYAAIYLGGNEASPKVGWYVNKMTDANGNSYQTLDSGTLLSPINLNDSFTLYLYWDGVQFSFKCIDSLGSETSATSIPGTGIYPSNIKYKDLQARILPTTSSNASTVSATFDDVQTNVRFLNLPLIMR